MLLHKNEWDSNHLEKPTRLEETLKLLRGTSVLSQCKSLGSREASSEDLELVHTAEYIKKIQQTDSLTQEERNKLSLSFDDVFFNQHTWNACLLSAGCALELLQAVLEDTKSNGFAAIRPPGHHASQSLACGFCIFNNVAICAKKARSLGCQRVLILDWDVHAAQGTQYCIEDDPGVRLISIHRFQQGTFWPELPESSAVQPYQNTINVPLNQVGLGDGEYIQVFHSLVLPFIEHWAPDLILVSAGYDAAIGDPEGEMEVTPGGFGYMTGILASLDISLCLFLEGGYFIESVAQGVLFTVQALLDRKAPAINLRVAKPSPIFLSSFFSTLSVYRYQNPVFDGWLQLLNNYRKNNKLAPIMEPVNEYQNYSLSSTFELTGLYTPRDKSIDEYYTQELGKIIESYKVIPTVQTPKIFLKISTGCLEFSDETQSNYLKFEHLSANQFLVLLYYMLLPMSLTYQVFFNQSTFCLADLPVYLNHFQYSNQIDHSTQEFHSLIQKLIDIFPDLKRFVHF